MKRELFEEELKKAERTLARRDETMRLLIRKYGPCTIRPHARYFETLTEAILSQQLSTKAAATIIDRFKKLYAPSRFPTASQILETPVEDLRATGVSMQKVSYLKDLSTRAAEGSLRLARVSQLDDEEVVGQLVAVKGIGVWTAHMFLIFSLGRLDVLPVGDLGVRKAIQINYGFAELPLAPAMEELATARGWVPYRSVASWYLWRSLENKSPSS